MNLKKRVFTIVSQFAFLNLLLILSINVFAQREYNICDSSFYYLNADTTIVAGKKHLYFYTNNALSVFHNFTTTDTNEYIRDFDVIKPNLWFTVVGSRYIGAPTKLYRSINHGQTWNLDTNHYNANNSQLTSPAFFSFY